MDFCCLLASFAFFQAVQLTLNKMKLNCGVT